MSTLRGALGAVLVFVGIVAGGGAAFGATAPAPVTVHIAGFSFKPAVLTVPVGTTVTFVNDDTEAHTVTATGKTFDSGGLDLHDSWKHTFSKVGSFAYVCQLHPYMKGKIFVTGGSK
jgi:plastocyanin